MTCIFLTGGSILSCRAGKGVCIPSIGELKRFCTTPATPVPSTRRRSAAAKERDTGRWSLAVQQQMQAARQTPS